MVNPCRDQSQEPVAHPYWEAEGNLYYVEMPQVAKSVYDKLDLERFDSLALAMKNHKKDEDDEED